VSSISFISISRSERREGIDMPIYEYRCEDCGRISEFLLIKTDETFIPQCNRCKSKKMSRVLSKVRVIRSEESRMESLADPSKWSGLDERDPKSMAKWMKRMGKELGEDMGEMDGLDEALEEEMAPKSDEELGQP
jgi:putative FmdB family regulatory protein